MARGSQGQSVLHRHLRVMDAFDALNPFLTLAQITQRSGLAHSTAQRIVRELEGERLLERMPDRTYRLGLRLWEFASRTPGGAGLRELARPWVAAVHARVRQHAQLGVRSGREILFIERMSTPDAVVNSTIIGGRMPLPVSSLGLVLLAYAGEDVIDAVVDEGWPAPTRFALRDEDSLRARLRRVRADGFAVTDGFIYEESRGIAVPVLASQERAYAALGVVVPNDAADPRPIIELLTVAAAGLANALRDSYLPEGGARSAGGVQSQPLLNLSKASADYIARQAARAGAPDPRSI